MSGLTEWWPLRIGSDRHHRWIEVRGPYRDDTGRVLGVSAEQQTEWCAEQDARLPTVEEYTAIWHSAEVAVYAKPRDPASPLDALSPDVSNALIAHGLPTVSVCAGKTWCIHERTTRNRAVNFGWWVPPEQVRKGRWRGIRVHSDGANGWVIQPPSATHNHRHRDYSQLGYAVRDMAPGYELVDDDEPDTQPDAAIWRDPSKSWGERAVMFSLAEMRAGVREEPAGSNTGPRIREYLAPATRYINGREVKLGLPSGNWCAAAYCFAQRMTALDDDALPPYRVSGIELERDAKKRGLWLPVDDVRRGKAKPKAGDGVVLTRGRAGWERHVCRIVEPFDGEAFMTIGGNERDAWQLTARLLRDERILGFLLHNT